MLCMWEVSHLMNVRVHARDTTIVNMLSYCMIQINLSLRARIKWCTCNILPFLSLPPSLPPAPPSLPPSDIVYWECHLADTIVPDKCKLSVGKVRAKVKLIVPATIGISQVVYRGHGTYIYIGRNLQEEPSILVESCDLSRYTILVTFEE